MPWTGISRSIVAESVTVLAAITVANRRAPLFPTGSDSGGLIQWPA